MVCGGGGRISTDEWPGAATDSWLSTFQLDSWQSYTGNL